MLQLNIGCGTDYREGFVNIDGSDSLSKVDKRLDLGKGGLLNHFARGEVSLILAQDIIEHFFHWQAVRLFREFYELLMPDGRVKIQAPDAQFILEKWRAPLQRKLTLLFGGQDVPQGFSAEMDRSRKRYPEFFCHKYGWTRESMETELRRVGFLQVTSKQAGANFVVCATR